MMCHSRRKVFFGELKEETEDVERRVVCLAICEL